MNDTATQTGAARTEPAPNPDVKSDEIEIRPNPRDAAIAAMGERQEQARRDEIDEAIATDPDLAAHQHRIDSAIADSNAEAGIVHPNEDTPSFGPSMGDTDGAASKRPMHQPEPEKPDLPSHLQDDPLADFIEMQSGQAMVKLKVNGQDSLLPLADAKRQLQIGTAAEVRMQAAAEREKQLEERETRLSAGEAALTARTTVASQQPTTPAPAAKGLSDEDLEKEATDIFETAFSGTEEDAAKKLAKTLTKIRDSAAARQPTQRIDTRAIAEQAASIATGRLTEQERQKGVSKGYAQFKTNYPDIMQDPHLFKMADDLTDTIESEHPDWDMTQIMDEAGKRTQAWVKNLSGQTEDTEVDDPTPKPGDQNSSVSDTTTQTRQERKAGLVRMPSSAAGAQHIDPEETPEGGEQTPQDAFRELKQSRGQPY